MSNVDITGSIDPFVAAKYAGRRNIRVFAGIDSLTEGSASYTPSSYLIPFATALRARYGDAGLGCIPCALGTAAFGVNLSKSAGVNYISSLAKTDALALKTPHFKGLYTSAAVAESWSYTPAAGHGVGTANIAWTSIRLHFIFLSSGASFKLRQFNLNAANGLVFDDADYEIGVPQVATYYYNAAYNQTFSCYDIVGDVLFGAIELINETLPGVSFGNFGRGGVLANEWAQLDHDINVGWWRNLRPDVFIYKAGMNDRSTRTVQQIVRDADTNIGRILEGSPNTKIMVVRSNDPSDAATTAYANLDKGLISFALSNGFGYADERDWIGDYATANAASDMFDGVHPDGSGNTKIGNGTAASVYL